MRLAGTVWVPTTLTTGMATGVEAPPVPVGRAGIERPGSTKMVVTVMTLSLDEELSVGAGASELELDSVGTLEELELDSVGAGSV